MFSKAFLQLFHQLNLRLQSQAVWLSGCRALWEVPAAGLDAERLNLADDEEVLNARLRQFLDEARHAPRKYRPPSHRLKTQLSAIAFCKARRTFSSSSWPLARSWLRSSS